MTLTATPGNQPFELSFSDVPLEELHRFLQELGDHLVIAARERRRPQLASFVKSNRQLLTALEKPKRSYPPTYRTVVRDAIRGERPLVAWETQTLSHFQQQLGLNAGSTIPEVLWELVGERAWNDPQFLQRTHTFLENSLRRRTLFVKDTLEESQFPLFRLSARTLWLLTAMAVHSERDYLAQHSRDSWRVRLFQSLRQPFATLLARVQRGQIPLFERLPLSVWVRIEQVLQRIVRAIDWLGRPRRALSRMSVTRGWSTMHKLAELGQRLALIPGWAGVWDQWLLLEAARSWSISEQSAMARALRQLPLNELYTVPAQGMVEDGETDEEKEKPVLLARPNWSRYMSTWFSAWLRAESEQSMQ